MHLAPRSVQIVGVICKVIPHRDPVPPVAPNVADSGREWRIASSKGPTEAAAVSCGAAGCRHLRQRSAPLVSAEVSRAGRAEEVAAGANGPWLLTRVSTHEARLVHKDQAGMLGEDRHSRCRYGSSPADFGGPPSPPSEDAQQDGRAAHTEESQVARAK